MREQKTTLPLTVNKRVRQLIEKECSKTTISARKKQRLLIILDGINGKSKLRSSIDLSTTRVKIYRWRNRWEESVDKLIEASEKGISGKAMKDYELLKMIEDTLSDKPGRGTTKRITLEQEEQIRALACTKPTEHGIQMTNWTNEMLTQVAKAKGIVDKISVRSVGNILKKTK